jgi:hypothetical protein
MRTYVMTLRVRVRQATRNSPFPTPILSLLYSITDEQLAQRLLVADDEYEILDPNGPFFQILDLLLREQMSIVSRIFGSKGS